MRCLKQAASLASHFGMTMREQLSALRRSPGRVQGIRLVVSGRRTHSVTTTFLRAPMHSDHRIHLGGS